MKKMILGFMALTGIMSANAQKGKMNYGIKAGINVSTLGVKQSGASQTAGSQIGFNGGAFVELPVCSNFSVQPEALYSMMGTKANTTKYLFNYINVPVLAKYKSGNLAVYAGPQVGFLMSAKGKNSGTTTDVKNGVKSIDFAGVFGTEFDCTHGIILSARYQLGFADINDGFVGSSSGKIKNQGFTFTVGYAFGK